MKEPSPDDLIRQLADEFKSQQRGLIGQMSFKDLVIHVSRDLRELNQILSRPNEQQQSTRASAVAALGLACLVLFWTLGVNRPDSDFLNEYNVEITGVGLMAGVLAVLLAAEGMPLVKAVIGSIPCQIAIGFFFALIVVTSTANANGALNQVLGVDASNAPIARVLLTAALVLKAMQPFFIVLFVAATIQLVLLIRGAITVLRGDRLLSDISGSAILLMFCCIVLSVTYAKVLFNGLKDDALPVRAYVLAHKFDFNDRALCLEGRFDAREARHSKYLYVGANQQKVLVGPKLSTSELGSWFFMDSELALRQGSIQPVLLDCAGTVPAVAPSASISHGN